MPAVHTLVSLQRAITDSRMLVQHRLRTAQAGCSEVLLLCGPRGHRFATEHLEPQVQLLRAASDALLSLSGVLEAAARQAQAAQEHLSRARLAVDAVHAAQAEARRLTARARELAALARDRVTSAEIRSRSIGSALEALGAPPVSSATM